MSLTPTEAIDPNLPRIWVQPHYRSFNGLRALAVLAVFTTHYAGFWNLGLPQYFLWSGVDLFFVLSGFLITGILYDSLQDPHYFRDFYVRRALRIFPIFYALFLLLFVLTPLLHLSYSPFLWTYPLYIGNLIFPFKMQAHVDIASISLLTHGVTTPIANVGPMWSLCVEEQFYLLWPAVVWWVRDRKRLMQLCLVVSVVAVPLRLYLYKWHNVGSLLYISTYTRFDTLLIGAFLALWLRGRALSLRQLQRISALLFWPPCLIVVAVILQLPRLNSGLVFQSPFVVTIGFTLIALAYAGLILRSLDDSSRISRVLRWRPLYAIGTISYGFYLIHMLPEGPLTQFNNQHHHLTKTIPIIAFVFTIALAGLSFRYLETPFLRLKRTLAPQRGGNDPTNPARLHVSEPSA